MGHGIFFVPTEKFVDSRSGLASKTLGFASVLKPRVVESDPESVKGTALFILLVGLCD